MVAVSVILPARDKRDALERTLAGFARQTFPPASMELIVVDDGSRDRTEELVEAFRPRLRAPLVYVAQAQRGRAAARNAGIAHARGALLVFNDADVIPGPELVAEHVRAHDSPGRVVLGRKCEILTAFQPGQPASLLESCLDRSSALRALDAPVAAARAGRAAAFLAAAEIEREPGCLERYSLGDAVHNYGAALAAFGDELAGFAVPWILFVTANASVSRTLVERTGGFDESFVGWGLEDVELGLRLHRAGARFRYAARAVSYHQVHSGSYTREPALWRELAANYARFCAKHPAVEVHLFWRFVTGRMSAVEYHERVRGEVSAAEREALAQAAADYARSNDPGPVS